MNPALKTAFIIHLCKYLGVALVSGSIVHAGTLGGSSMKYLVLIVTGILLTVVGNYLENKEEHKAIDTRFLLLAIGLSFGTGMLSGGVQHYLDNPAYGALLLGLGTMLTFATLAYKDFKSAVNKLTLIIVAVISVILYSFLAYALPTVVPTSAHHEDAIDTH